MGTIYVNNLAAQIAANIGPSDTAILLGPGQGAAFPSPAAQEWFYCTLVHSVTGAIEVVQCTGRVGDTLTVVRGRDNTSAISFLTGSLVEPRATAEMFREIDYRTVRGQNNGLAELDGTAKLAAGQIPTTVLLVATAAATYIPLAQRAAANGVATLDGTTKIPIAQIPTLPYLSSTAGGAVGGAVSVTGTVTASSGVFSTSGFLGTTGAALVLFNSSAGSISLRPNGSASTTNQGVYAQTGVFTCVDLVTTSDKRKKRDIRKVEARPVGDWLNFKSFAWKYDGRPGLGIIAQDLQEVAPEYVSRDDEGFLQVDKIGLLLEAVVNLTARVRELEKQLKRK